MTVLDEHHDILPVAAPADFGAGSGPAWLDAWLAAHAGELVGWRRSLHAVPELGRAERRTTAFVAAALMAAASSRAPCPAAPAWSATSARRALRGPARRPRRAPAAGGHRPALRLDGRGRHARLRARRAHRHAARRRARARRAPEAARPGAADLPARRGDPARRRDRRGRRRRDGRRRADLRAALRPAAARRAARDPGRADHVGVRRAARSGSPRRAGTRRARTSRPTSSRPSGC